MRNAWCICLFTDQQAGKLTLGCALQEVVPELRALAELFCDSLEEGLQALCKARCSSSEVKAALRTTDRCLKVLTLQAGW